MLGNFQRTREGVLNGMPVNDEIRETREYGQTIVQAEFFAADPAFWKNRPYKLIPRFLERFLSPVPRIRPLVHRNVLPPFCKIDSRLREQLALLPRGFLGKTRALRK